MSQIVRDFRKKMENGGTVLGPFSSTGDPALVEASGYAGFDFIILDMEHGPSNVMNMQNLIRGAETAGIMPIVRVPYENLRDVGRVLDIGAGGVQVPQITNGAMAREAVKNAKFAPEGMRGVSIYVRQGRFAQIDRNKFFKEANDAVLILQIEGKEAFENVDEILSVEGIDIIFFGVYDLSQSLGVPGQVENELVVNTVRELSAKCLKRGIAAGVFCDTLHALENYKKMGIQYLSYSVDIGLYAEYVRSLVEKYKAL